MGLVQSPALFCADCVTRKLDAGDEVAGPLAGQAGAFLSLVEEEPLTPGAPGLKGVALVVDR
jgi:hypothetical protein